MTTTPRPVGKRSMALLNDPFLNKGLAFPPSERAAFGLNDLLPAGQRTLEQQVALARQHVLDQQGDLARNTALRGLQDENETVFYALLESHLAEMMPLVYTPAVGEGCLHFSETWRKPRGLFLAAPERASFKDILAQAPDGIRLVIVTDGERILGLGDLGANGMGIPIGKLALYTACAGINPTMMLPVTLDVGTDNQPLRESPDYIGWRHERLRGADYDAVVEAFVSAITERWPHVLLHWEDFANRNAAPLLARYKHRLPSFNDDIEGTAAIAAAAMLAGVKAKGEKLSDQRIALAGGGSAGCGIAALLLKAMEDEGLSRSEAAKRFYLFDRQGLLTSDMADLTPAQKVFARTDVRQHDQGRDLESACARIHPTILVGVTGKGGLFSEGLVRNMASHTKRPMVFPLSNPTRFAEATPADIMKWTDGRAMVSTGSPFPPVMVDGKPTTIAQTNNAYVYPGLGLGALASGAGSVSTAMLMAAARTVADCSPLLHGGANMLPPATDMAAIARKVAVAVAQAAMAEGLCPPLTENALEARIKALSWKPAYGPYVPA
ncbi:NAD-dependent malic enzyme [Formicincola oecophyllae]|uniref:NAD-dependent malic enzyme n=1 Tax=Formicincola oecophyllae TaxID=2558361 RepID=A0A4Y6UAZ6_9PROT|nr:NAD-dependent malic enzyme [Formicincola oecophyllae]QDH13748.1 NAD-dependent malic enzyme [Formicincola oecophyllae]